MVVMTTSGSLRTGGGAMRAGAPGSWRKPCWSTPWREIVTGLPSQGKRSDLSHEGKGSPWKDLKCWGDMFRCEF